MRKWIIKEKDINSDEKTAGNKARDDIEEILAQNGYTVVEFVSPVFDRNSGNPIKKLNLHYKVKKIWDRFLQKLEKGDIVIFQFPIVNHSFFLDSTIKQLINKGVTVIAFIHDVECLRFVKRKEIDYKLRLRLYREEVSILKCFSKIIVHNGKMKKTLHNFYKIPKRKMISLVMFDYLVNDANKIKALSNYKRSNNCIIAGNMKQEKAGYAYKLPENYSFELYGPNYSGEEYGNIIYRGAFMPKELPEILNGDFGLVWDGNSANTCAGVYGDYLKINNPHKTSLYLACGIPVVVWEKAAVADFIKKYKCGVTVSSLYELKNVLDSISEEDYNKIRYNAANISKKLINGYFTKHALNRSLNRQ